MSYFDKQDALFCVLKNKEGQYSLWPKSKSIPGGWTSEKIEGNKAECLEYISNNWTDMRPLSLVEQMNSDK
jgi:MbtH protein